MSAEEIVAAVARRRGIDVRRLRGHERQHDITRARHEAMWLLRAYAKLSYPQIGRALGNRDHSTAYFAILRIWRFIYERPAYERELRSLVSPEPRLPEGVGL